MFADSEISPINSASKRQPAAASAGQIPRIEKSTSALNSLSNTDQKTNAKKGSGRRMAGIQSSKMSKGLSIRDEEAAATAFSPERDDASKKLSFSLPNSRQPTAQKRKSRHPSNMSNASSQRGDAKKDRSRRKPAALVTRLDQTPAGSLKNDGKEVSTPGIQGAAKEYQQRALKKGSIGTHSEDKNLSYMNISRSQAEYSEIDQSFIDKSHVGDKIKYLQQ